MLNLSPLDRHLIQLCRAIVSIQRHLWEQKLAKTSIYNLHVVLVFALPQYYLGTAKQHLSLTGPKQLFFHSTTTYWVKQSTQPSLAIPLGVPRAYAKSLQLSLPYLLLMSALRYTNPRHYQSPLSHAFKRDFSVFSVILSVLFFPSNVLLEICRWRKVTWQLWIPSAGCSNWPSQPINFLLPSQTASIAPCPEDRPYNVFLEVRHEREGKLTDSHHWEFFMIHSWGRLQNTWISMLVVLRVVCCERFSQC